MNAFLKRFSQVLIGLLFLVGAVAISGLLWITRPIAEEKPYVEYVPTVEYTTARRETLSFVLPTQGLVEAKRRTELAAEVAGKVVEVSPHFKTGLRVKRGDWLIKLDPTDYEAAKAAAAATLAEAEVTLANEEAKATQARRDWAKLGHGGAPPDLLLRGPQIRSAAAHIESAKASLAKAEADLRRCQLTAPYDAVLASTQTELGSYLTPGFVVASIFESDVYEVRLPLSVDQLQFLDLKDGASEMGSVEIHSSFGGTTTRFPARIIRSEGEIDRASRSAYLVAEVKSEPGTAGTLQPGLFVKATLQGRSIPDLMCIPFSAFVDLEQVAIIAPDDTLLFRPVKVLYREDDKVYVSSGLEEGERVCLTELPSMITGLKVIPVSEKEASTTQRYEPETSVIP